MTYSVKDLVAAIRFANLLLAGKKTSTHLKAVLGQDCPSTIQYKTEYRCTLIMNQGSCIDALAQYLRSVADELSPHTCVGTKSTGNEVK
jgi:hypothetical protein